MKYTYGPVHSRRLGLSLGVNITPGRVCSFNCIYCEEGTPTQELTLERREYAPTDQVVQEIKSQASKDLDYITFSGAGEPTLHIDLGTIISDIKELDIPIAVLTNSSLLYLAGVREDLKKADLVVPSLDSIRDQSYQLINRPCPDLPLDLILEGFKKFCHEYEGDIWVEILFVRGINDTLEEVKELASFINPLPIDGIQLNTVSRGPTVSGTGPVDMSRLEEFKAYFVHPTKLFD